MRADSVLRLFWRNVRHRWQERRDRKRRPIGPHSPITERLQRVWQVKE